MATGLLLVNAGGVGLPNAGGQFNGDQRVF
jgi:hypothetical protein